MYCHRLEGTEENTPIDGTCREVKKKNQKTDNDLKLVRKWRKNGV